MKLTDIKIETGKLLAEVEFDPRIVVLGLEDVAGRLLSDKETRDYLRRKGYGDLVDRLSAINNQKAIRNGGHPDANRKGRKS